ncbi:hypothetical protein SJAV_20240 [Sulfurisphaera javensis]|uniref:Endonuclease GajA/Old nuclease/RecF-like AAA domain-containing protein n=1 Tax=Sulfurisphaera javensis TaxID=2049879 RepID=A0AAT9GTX0_9CREN
MKLIVHKLGPLKETEIEINTPITILFGRSNTGKSYVLKALYSLLSFLDKSNEERIIDSILGNINFLENKMLEIDFATHIRTVIDFLRNSLVGESNVELYLNGKRSEDLIKELGEKIRKIDFKEETYEEKDIYSSFPQPQRVSVKLRDGKLLLNKATTQASYSLISFLANSVRNYLSDVVLPIIEKKAKDLFEIPSVRYLNYGRFVALYGNLDDPYFSSSSYWIKNGKNLVKQGKINSEIEKLFNLSIKIKKEELTINGYSPAHSSASLVELSSLFLAVADGEGGLLLIEEPETQLDVYSQIKIGVILYLLSKRFKIVFSTHSEILLLTMAMLSRFSECAKDVLISRIKELVDIENLDNLDHVDVNFYFFDKGKVEKRSAKEILANAEIFTDLNNKLLDSITELVLAWEEKCQQR